MVVGNKGQEVSKGSDEVETHGDWIVVEKRKEAPKAHKQKVSNGKDGQEGGVSSKKMEIGSDKNAKEKEVVQHLDPKDKVDSKGKDQPSKRNKRTGGVAKKTSRPKMAHAKGVLQVVEFENPFLRKKDSQLRMMEGPS